MRLIDKLRRRDRSKWQAAFDSLREVKWCNVHDIAWASHPEVGVSFDGCVPGVRFIADPMDGETP